MKTRNLIMRVVSFVYKLVQGSMLFYRYKIIE